MLNLNALKIASLLLGFATTCLGVLYDNNPVKVLGALFGTAFAVAIHFVQQRHDEKIDARTGEIHRRQLFPITPFAVEVDFELPVVETEDEEDLSILIELYTEEPEYRERFWCWIIGFDAGAGGYPGDPSGIDFRSQFASWEVARSWQRGKRWLRISGTTPQIPPTHLGQNISSIVDLLHLMFLMTVQGPARSGQTPEIQELRLVFASGHRLTFDRSYMEVMPNKPTTGDETLAGQPRERSDSHFLAPGS